MSDYTYSGSSGGSSGGSGGNSGGSGSGSGSGSGGYSFPANYDPGVTVNSDGSKNVTKKKKASGQGDCKDQAGKKDKK